MLTYKKYVFAVFAVFAALLIALHSPGEMSVDSVMALYEGAINAAVGWGPTFMASAISWLGGGLLGTSLMVGITCVLTYGCFALLLTSFSGVKIPSWQVIVALILALNPLFMFYVGIIWKDVLLATISLVAATILLLAVNKHGSGRYALIGIAIALSGMAVPIRQQGVLIALPFACVAAGLVITELQARKFVSVTIVFVSIALVFLCSTGFYVASALTVRPQAHGPVSVGIRTIQAYDISGMIAMADPDDPSKWSGASSQVKSDIKARYSSQRIDTIWHLPTIRGYFNGLSDRKITSVWLRGIEHSPMTYFRARAHAFSELLGLHQIAGCVPAYWGVYGLPSQVKALGLENKMDVRALSIKHVAEALYATPVFRNWFYALILFFASTIAVFRLSGETRMVAIGVSVSGWLYFLSFIPTTIACDVRYLYPVATVATVLCIFVLTRTKVVVGLPNVRRRKEGDPSSNGE